MDARHLLVAVGLLMPAQAAAHEWYADLKNKLGHVCCNNKDCKVVSLCYGSDGKEGVEHLGSCLPIPPHAVLDMPSPDGEAHACILGGVVRCAILPGMT
jgi:hypothetical protein